MDMYLASREPIEIFLQPGDFYFGDRHTRIRTLLGSCVSITLWHPRLKIGGMCHYLLPCQTRQHALLDGRYADGVIGLFMQELRSNGTQPEEYEAKLFGGGRMFKTAYQGKIIDAMDVGMRNIEAGRRLLHEHRFQIKAEHLAGNGHRNLVFDLASGEVWLRHVAAPALDHEPLNLGKKA